MILAHGRLHASGLFGASKYTVAIAKVKTERVAFGINDYLDSEKGAAVTV